ncbi:MAG TPA: ABC transporter permease, partial [Candidatus Acidoferrum sp.]|nr:ABC transporter permease [Candidatus Acidoferrum sp.]
MTWIKQLFSRRRLYDELSEEIEQHLEEKIEELVAEGMSRPEATAAARRQFGSVTLTEEESREVWQWPSLESFLADLRFGARTLRKSLAFTAVAVLTLALGMGANTAIFSLVNGILLVPLPYPEPDRLMSVTGAYPEGALVAMREQVRTMEVGAYAEGHDLNLTGQGEPVRLTATLVSAELFSILKAQPELGRVFERGEDVPGKDNYVLLGHALWQQHFAGDRTIIGRSIELEGVSREVVGVMPADFHF